VLAAEEFAVPGGGPRAVPPGFTGDLGRGPGTGAGAKLALTLGAGLLLLGVLRRRRAAG
jgi:hypothetical protein